MKIALVGNQNSGKTSLFNDLTGSNQKIGNWPGVTIERKEGYLKGSNDNIIVDLPGIYSLSPYTTEEEVSRRYVIDEKPDLIINIIDSTSLERSLYLTTQLLELDCDVILALNMSDILESHGLKIDVEKLSKSLGATIVQVSAMKNTGIDELINIINKKKYIHNPHIHIYPENIESVIEQFSKKINADNKRFAAVKLIEDDRGYHGLISNEGEAVVKALEKETEMDGEQLIASRRYDFIEKVKKECVIASPRKESITDKLDRVILNKWAAIPIFIGLMAFIYFISIGLVGGLTTPLINVLFNGASKSSPTEFHVLFGSFTAKIDFIGIGPGLAKAISNGGGALWSQSLVANGIVAGIASILSFLPQIAVMFLFLSLLETTGYMSRIAFFLDRIFHKFGLSGKSLIPFIVGSGCGVPGIMTTRIVEDENERKSTAILTTFIPCSAKLPIISVFASFFFKNVAWLVSLSFYVIAILLILIFGYLFKKFVFKGEHSTFVSELPEYKLPSALYVTRDVWDKVWAFLKKAGTIILFANIIIWVLTSFTWDFHFIDGNVYKIEQSMLAGIGNVFAWFFYPMLGKWSWGATVASIQGLIAKEQVVTSLEVIARVGEGQSIFTSSLFSWMTGATAYAYLTFNLFSAPCVAALAALRKETGSWKTFFFGVAFQISVAWVLATLIGVIGRAV